MSAWKFLKSQWKTSLLGLTILVVAALSLTWAIVTNEGDIGFIKGTKGQSLRWEALPVTCVYDPKSLPPEAVVRYDKARLYMNKALGVLAFGGCVPWALSVPLPEVVDGELVLRVGEPENTQGFQPHPKEKAATTFLLENQEGYLAAAQLWVRPAYVEDPRVWIHELGHIIGLDHDRLKNSVMYRDFEGRSSSLSEKDIKVFKEEYYGKSSR